MRFLLPILALPLVEIAGFVLVGGEIGVLPTVALVVLSSIVGSALVRLQGFGVLARIRQQLAEGKNPGREVAHGVMILLAGILLLIPGFVTDIVGLLLFVPSIRDLGWRLVKRRLAAADGVIVTSTGWGPRPAGSDKTIDLDAQDYSRAANPRSPWKRLRPK
jgi:UPF0716 protein FxsA